MEDRTHSFNFYNFPTTEAADYLSVGTWPNSGHSFRKPMLLNKTKAFFGFCFFGSFSCPPLGPGREKGLLFHLKRAARKIELKPLFSFSIVTIFPPRRQPTTLVSARGPTAGTPSGKL